MLLTFNFAKYEFIIWTQVLYKLSKVCPLSCIKVNVFLVSYHFVIDEISVCLFTIRIKTFISFNKLTLKPFRVFLDEGLWMFSKLTDLTKMELWSFVLNKWVFVFTLFSTEFTIVFKFTKSTVHFNIYLEKNS